MKLSIILSARNDPIGALFTARSALEELRGLSGEIIIVDNSELHHKRQHLAALLPRDYQSTGQVQLLFYDTPCIFSSRELAVSHATGDLLVFLDSHMLLGRNSLRAFHEFFLRHWADPRVGFAYGPLCYHHKEEGYSYHTRHIENFLGLIYRHPAERRIAFRGVPMCCRRELFYSIGGYGALSQHELGWGGGDTHLGIKPWLFNYENWLVPDALGIHIGPFESDPYLLPSYSASALRETSRFLGFLVVAYVIGGEELLSLRAAHVSRRLEEDFTYETFAEARRLGADERRWILDNQTCSYERLVRERPWDSEDSPADFVTKKNWSRPANLELVHPRPKPKPKPVAPPPRNRDDWRSRIENARRRASAS